MLEFCGHEQANWIIRHTKKAAEIDLLNFHIFLAHPIVHTQSDKHNVEGL